MRIITKKIVVLLVIILTTQLTSCKSGISEKDKKDMKTAIDVVLSNEGYYEGDVTKYTSGETYYTTNYFIFYSLFMDQPNLTYYESEVRSVKKTGNKYIACVVVNIEAESESLHSDEGEEDTKSEDNMEEKPHKDTAVGEDVPVEIVLKKIEGNFYVVSSKEYDNLQLAIKDNEGFREREDN